ncbi:MAG: hypothetical protein ACE363_09120 [Alphaproteobacteria bacterium]
MSFYKISRFAAAALAVSIASQPMALFAQSPDGYQPLETQTQREQTAPYDPMAPGPAAPPPAPVQSPDAPLSIVPRGVTGSSGVGPRVPAPAQQPRFGNQGFDDAIVGVAPAADPVVSGGVAELGLAEIDPSSVGVLVEDSGGFPATMWEGSNRASLMALLPQLPVNTRSPVMRELARRLLLTEADVPAPEPPSGLLGAPVNDPYDLLKARVERLAAAGDLAGLSALFDRMPPSTEDETLTRHRIDVMLLNGDVAGACAEAGSANQRSENTYWFQIVAFCRLIEGDTSGANFATDMLRDLGIDDPVYFDLMAYLMLPEQSRAGVLGGSIGEPTPLKLAMLRVAGLDVPVETLVQASPLMLQAIATTPNMPIPLRLEAADMAARQGAIDVSMLAALYGGMPFEPAELENAALLAEAGGAARTQALLYQAARRSPVPETRATNLQAAWRVARARNDYSIAAAANLQATQALPIQPPMLPYAADVTKALLVAGDEASAMRWYNLVRNAASTADVNATTLLLELWPFMQVADVEGNIPFSNDILDLWWQSQFANSRAERAERGALLFAVFEALGDQVPPRYWASLYDGAERQQDSMPSLPAWRGTLMAARSGRLAETVLLTLILLGEEGPGAANPAVLANVIEALRAVGLEHEARALTLEALVEAGL